MAALAGLGFWATILRIDAFVSPFGTGLIYQTSTSRVGYGLARNRYFPQIFQWVDRNGVPWFSLIMAFVFGLFFLLPFPSWQSLVGLVTSASVLMYAGAPLSLGAFRRKLPDAVRPYRVPVAAVMSPLGFIICSMLIYWSGFVVVWKLGVCLVIGYILIGISMAFDPQRPPLQWKSAQWLLPYLIGMGIISWLGQYPLKGDGRRAADQHLPHPVLVGHPDRGGLQPGHLLLGDVHRPAARGDAGAGRPAERAGRTAGHRAAPLSPAHPKREWPRRTGGATRVCPDGDRRPAAYHGPFGQNERRGAAAGAVLSGRGRQ